MNAPLLKVFDDPFVPLPAGQSSYPTWLQLIWHPAERGHSYTVKRGPEGTPFRAYLSYGYDWRIVTGKNPDASLILGDKIGQHWNLWYVARILP